MIHYETRFFKESSEEEREHAEKLMEYQVLYKILSLSLNIPSSQIHNHNQNLIFFNKEIVGI